LAVLIGSSEFAPDSGFPPLRCPLRDADGMRDILVSLGGFAEPVLLKNEPYGKVLETTEGVFRQATSDDLVLFYYSGHGKLDLKGNLYLATPDTQAERPLTTSVPAQAIRTILENSECTKAILIFDCCYSAKAAAGYKSAQVNAELKTLATEDRGTYILSASTGYQVAKEPPNGPYSIFTGLLIEGIRGGAPPARDGGITVDALRRYVSDRMRGGAQKPVMTGFNIEGAMVIAHRDRGRSAVPRRRGRVFISCDEAAAPIVRELRQALAGECEFFVDTEMPVGVVRATWIADKLKVSDAMIVFVSDRSAGSWKVHTELDTAQRLAGERGGGPVVIPVRVGALPPLTAPLAEYLNPLQWTTWKDPDDTVRLLNDLRQGIDLAKGAHRSGTGRVRRAARRRSRR
jgi:hypothetical protein